MDGSNNLNPDTIRWAIGHIAKHGDTDIFPHPFELAFLSDMRDDVSEALSRQNLTMFRPISVLESLVPKSRYGFRVAQQLYPIDTVVLTAAVAEIGNDIELARCDIDWNVAYSYRFSPNDEFDFFSSDCKYRQWLSDQWIYLALSEEYVSVVEADISDFYQRIYHHRLENCMGAVTKNRKYVELIKRIIRDIRVRQSFGLPVGCNASRLLAELLLNDIDRALLAEGYSFTRYVDDYRFFLTEKQDPYALLAFLAEHLMTEGLSLNPSKTKVHSREEYLSKISDISGEDADQAHESASDRLLFRLYDSEEVDEEALRDLASKDLVAELQAELAEPFWDVGAIRVLLRCLKLTKSQEAEKFIKENFRRLLPFVKDVVLLMEELKKEGVASFDDQVDEVVEILLEPVAERLQVVRAWMLELFLRQVIPISPAILRKLQNLPSQWDQRALVMLRGQLNDVAYFRARKTRLDELNVWVQPAFVFAAACLPRDEYETWIGNIKKGLSFPLSDIFCKWAIDRQKARGA